MTKLKELLKGMRQRWPAAFEIVKPLKLGIRQDLIAESCEEQDADAFLDWYVRQPEYLAEQARAGAQRYDLRGQPCGPVSAGNAQYAAQWLVWVRAEQAHTIDGQPPCPKSLLRRPRRGR